MEERIVVYKRGSHASLPNLPSAKTREGSPLWWQCARVLCQLPWG